MRSGLRFGFAVALFTLAAGAAIAGQADGTWDVTLGEDSWNAENPAGSRASARDKQLDDALSAAFAGDTASWCKQGGECWTEVRDVACDRAAATCTATGAADVVDPESPFALSARGKAARALITQLAQRSWCDADRCRLGAIACFTDRHDELAGRRDAHRTYTCEVHRAPLPADPPPEP